MRRLIPLLCAAALTCIALACSHADDEGTATGRPVTDDAYTEALARLGERLDATPAPATRDDSLSFYLGVCEGMTYAEKARQATDAEKADMNPDDYLLGIHSVLQGDTVGVSYARGVSLGVEAARFIAILESQGVDINRRLLAATIATMLENPALDSITRSHADSIAGRIIARHQNLKDR